MRVDRIHSIPPFPIFGSYLGRNSSTWTITRMRGVRGESDHVTGLSQNGFLSELSQGSVERVDRRFAFEIEGILPGEVVYADRWVNATSILPGRSRMWIFLLNGEKQLESGNSFPGPGRLSYYGNHLLAIQAKKGESVVGEEGNSLLNRANPDVVGRLRSADLRREMCCLSRPKCNHFSPSHRGIVANLL